MKERIPAIITAVPVVLALTLALVFGLTGCDRKAGEVLVCSLEDSKLSVAFRDSARARDYLKDLGARLKAQEPEAAAEALDLTQRLVECLPE